MAAVLPALILALGASAAPSLSRLTRLSTPSLTRGSPRIPAFNPTAAKISQSAKSSPVLAAKPPRRSLVARASDAQEPESRLPLLAPPLAVAAAYALVKVSPLDQALTTFIEGNGYPQMFRDLAMPDFFYNWFHAANMAIAGGAMGGYGAWLGFETKAGRGDEPAWGALAGGNKRTLHKQLMAGAALVFAAGGLGGVTFMLTNNKAIFESPHAITGMAEIFLLLTQAAIAVNMKGNASLKDAHAKLGAITMTILAVHAALGVKLGLGM